MAIRTEKELAELLTPGGELKDIFKPAPKFDPFTAKGRTLLQKYRGAVARMLVGQIPDGFRFEDLVVRAHREPHLYRRYFELMKRMGEIDEQIRYPRKLYRPRAARYPEPVRPKVRPAIKPVKPVVAPRAAAPEVLKRMVVGQVDELGRELAEDLAAMKPRREYQIHPKVPYAKAREMAYWRKLADRVIDDVARKGHFDDAVLGEFRDRWTIKKVGDELDRLHMKGVKRTTVRDKIAGVLRGRQIIGGIGAGPGEWGRVAPGLMGVISSALLNIALSPEIAHAPEGPEFYRHVRLPVGLPVEGLVERELLPGTGYPALR